MRAAVKDLPPMREVAEDLQDGVALADLCRRYNVTSRELMGRLRTSGYRPDGSVIGRPPRPGGSPALVTAHADTVPLTGYGGSDNHAGVSRHPTGIPHPIGLDWATGELRWSR